MLLMAPGYFEKGEMFLRLSSIACVFPVNTAIEILSDPVKRRAYDSIDPTFDNTVPTKSEGKENFFDVFVPVFERNSR